MSLDQLRCHEQYSLRDLGVCGRMVILRQQMNRLFTVANVESVEQWDRFVAALESGADEVAAVHAIDDLGCQRCGSALDRRGRCTDDVCPFTDYAQTDSRGWAGHPEVDGEGR